MFLIVFLFFWLLFLSFQCRAIHKFDGVVDMKNYTFCSNLIVTFPKWLIVCLFFNTRLVNLPLTIVAGQIFNDIAIGVYIAAMLQRATTLFIPLIKIWGWLIFVLLIVMCVDHEVYCQKNK
jgi:hypothetical protein